MFMSRVIVSGAPLVCRVESTRWPVRAALMAISAVSKSRISPTRMMLGSCVRMRAVRGKIQTDLFFHLDLVDSGELKLNRILGRHDVVSGVFKRAIEE